jgi:hypothetical protein
VPPANELVHSTRAAPQGWRAIEEIAAGLADRGLGAGLVQAAEPGGGLALLSVRQRLTVWCRGETVWWREPDGSYDQLDTSDLVEVIERIVCAHEELAAAGPSGEDATTPAACACTANQVQPTQCQHEPAQYESAQYQPTDGQPAEDQPLQWETGFDLSC